MNKFRKIVSLAPLFATILLFGCDGANQPPKTDLPLTVSEAVGKLPDPRQFGPGALAAASKQARDIAYSAASDGANLAPGSYMTIWQNGALDDISATYYAEIRHLFSLLTTMDSSGSHEFPAGSTEAVCTQNPVKMSWSSDASSTTVLVTMIADSSGSPSTEEPTYFHICLVIDRDPSEFGFSMTFQNLSWPTYLQVSQYDAATKTTCGAWLPTVLSADVEPSFHFYFQGRQTSDSLLELGVYKIISGTEASNYGFATPDGAIFTSDFGLPSASYTYFDKNHQDFLDVSSDGSTYRFNAFASYPAKLAVTDDKTTAYIDTDGDNALDGGEDTLSLSARPNYPLSFDDGSTYSTDKAMNAPTQVPYLVVSQGASLPTFGGTPLALASSLATLKGTLDAGSAERGAAYLEKLKTTDITPFVDLAIAAQKHTYP